MSEFRARAVSARRLSLANDDQGFAVVLKRMIFPGEVPQCPLREARSHQHFIDLRTILTIGAVPAARDQLSESRLVGAERGRMQRSATNGCAPVPHGWNGWRIDFASTCGPLQLTYQLDAFAEIQSPAL